VLLREGQNSNGEVKANSWKLRTKTSGVAEQRKALEPVTEIE
jgi:hypothetical protein